MKKVKVLCVMSDSTSVGHFRIGWPSAYIRDNYDDIEITIKRIENIMVWDMLALKQFDVIHFNRLFGYIESVDELFPMLQSHGIKLVMDIDDHWDIPKEFTAKQTMLDTLGGSMDGILNIIRKVDCVTTTTEFFRKELLELNKNVVVLPNAIDMSHRMWEDAVESEVVRIGWLGSAQRHYDLLKLKKSIRKLYADPELKGKFTITQCGGEEVNNEIFEGDGFVWRKQLPPFEYGVYYKDIDISLAPLKDNIYNRCKSELKMVEAGMNKKVFVCQDYGIYHEHISDGVNGFLIDDDLKWYKVLKNLILNKDLRDNVSEKLNQYVKDKFGMEQSAKKRIEFYKNLCDGKSN